MCHGAQSSQAPVNQSLAPSWIPPEAWVILRRGSPSSNCRPPLPIAHCRSPVGGGGRLTPRELQVLQGMMAGLGMNTIAQRMAIKLGTVKGHRLRLYRKLGCRPPEPPDDKFEPHTIVARAWEIIEEARKALQECRNR